MKEEEGEPDLLVSFTESETIDTDISDYCAVLEDFGFEKQENPGIHGGTLFYYYPMVNEEEIPVAVEVVNIEGYFAISLAVLDITE